MVDFDISRGIKFCAEGRFEDALDFFFNCPEPENAEEASELAFYSGLCYIKLEQYEAAMNALEQAITACKEKAKVARARLLLSFAYTKTGRLKLAEEELRILDHSETDQNEALAVQNAIGYLAFEKGDVDRAIECYEKVLEVSPKNVTAMNGLGYVLADTNQKLPKALTLCKQAVEANPDYVPYLDSLAWVYHKMNFPNEAKKLIQKVKEMVPNDEIVKKHYDEIFNK